MIICPNCQHKDFSGALFCSQCGAQLMAAVSSAMPSSLRQKDPMTKTSSNSKQKTGSKPAPSAAAGEARITLHLVESGQILPLAERMEFSLGSLEAPSMPDIDLTPYKAYDRAFHAPCNIGRVKNKIVIMGRIIQHIRERSPSCHRSSMFSAWECHPPGKLKIKFYLARTKSKAR